ncbi:MAG: hypothetical protein ABSC50_13465 [Candidatus Bathyarchaeia archaeon]|jgi:hypothetical protein
MSQSEANPDDGRWFDNLENKKERQLEMERSGIPLEIRAKRRLRSLGYRAFRTYYRSEDNESSVYRELDFLAEKHIMSFDVPQGKQFGFQLMLLGECKRSQAHDFFLFKIEEQEDMLAISDFPIRFLSPPLPLTITTGSLPKHYQMPFYTDRIVEVDAAKYRNPGKDNYNDRVTHEACENLLNASKYFRDRYAIVYGSAMANLREEIDDLYEAEDPTDQKTLESRTENVFLKSSDEFCKRFSFPDGILAVPFLVLDDNRYLVSATVDQQGKVAFEGQIDAAVCLYMSEHVDNFRDLLGLGPFFPVMVCKHATLSKAVKIVEDGTTNLLGEFKQNFVEKDPMWIPKRLALEATRLSPGKT